MVNVGSVDRALRFVLAAVLLAIPFLPPLMGPLEGWGISRNAVWIAGAAVFGSALFRFCFAYTLFGIRTCEIKKS